MTKINNIAEKNTKELKAIAKELKVANWWTLRKENLIEEIEKITAEEKKTGRGRKGILIEYNGEALNLNAWAKKLGIPGQTLFGRINNLGWTVEKAFTTPVRKAVNK